MPLKIIKKILQARVYDVAHETPIEAARFLTKRLNNHVLFKREDLQPVYSFKVRGAYNKIVNLSAEDQAKGVIAASAGNHAQGVALAAAQLGIQATIVMPTTTPEIKVSSVAALGGIVVLHGDSFDDAYAYAQDLMDQHGYCFVHPYDDEDVIAGQGTVGMEILRQISGPLDAVFVPVGGGGLIAGVSCYIKYLRPDIKVIAVESEDSACFKAAMDAGKRVILPEVGLFADGVAVKQIGKETFRLARQCVDEVITVSTDEICAAIKDVFDDARCITEPAGALSVAGLKKYVKNHGVLDQTLLAITSGANVNFDRLRHIAERSELGEKREAIFAVTIPEETGSFKTFCKTLGKRSITEFNYRFAGGELAHVFVGVQTKSSAEVDILQTELSEKGYSVVNLSDNEMAKLHIRHLVGGHGPSKREVADHEGNAAEEELELVFRFEFPERPGALLAFLQTLGSRWNISLFHYRNHGAAFGRVLVGMQVPEGEQKMVETYFSDLGYRYWDESNNPAYQLFLK
ncbi:PLP-dependent threonine dehydratase [Gammaproteobacteria bacterium 42_54_T18]|nr:PLP-dependent threonine dehydratase [Gammaproteobacteria bacterium 42_54_T18]